jgi:hypothetical protein
VLEVTALCLKMSPPPREKEKKEKPKSHRRGNLIWFFCKKYDLVKSKIKMHLSAQISHIVEVNIET